MGSKRFTPVVIGVGDIKNKSAEAIEPMKLMLQATLNALKDTNLPSTSVEKLQSSIDSVSVVATWTWNYPDLPGLLAENLGVKPSYKILSPHGGDSPAKLFDEAARRISFGESKVAVVTGGEALASCLYSICMRKEVLLKYYSGSLCSGWKATSSRMDSAGRERPHGLFVKCQ